MTSRTSVGGTVATQTLTVPLGETIDFTVPATETGAQFASTGGENFYAFATIDREGELSDWGYPLLPASVLTPQVLVGLGLGLDPDVRAGIPPPPSNENKSPIWISWYSNDPLDPVNPGVDPETDVTLYVDYLNDPPAGGRPTDPQGNEYDVSFTLKEYDFAKVYDPEDLDQTGILVYSLDERVRVAAVWGQDPERTVSLGDAIDLGTGIPPLPSFTAVKRSVLQIDSDGDRFISPGDTLRYEIVIENTSRFPVPDLTIQDVLPPTVDYVPGSTLFSNSQVSGVLVPDASGGVFPFEGVDYDLADFDQNSVTPSDGGVLPVGQQWQVTYDVTVKNFLDLEALGLSSIENAASIKAIELITLSSTIDLLRRKIGDFVWSDDDQDGIQDPGELGVNGVTVNLLDTSGNPVLDDSNNPFTTVTGVDAFGDPAPDGFYQFIGVPAGFYIVEVVAPSGNTFTLQDIGSGPSPDDNDSDVNPLTGRTAFFELKGGGNDQQRGRRTRSGKHHWRFCLGGCERRRLAERGKWSERGHRQPAGCLL